MKTDQTVQILRLIRVVLGMKIILLVLNLSRIMRKPADCICENNGPDQLHGNSTAYQCLCLHIDSTLNYFINPKFQASSHLLWL